MAKLLDYVVSGGSVSDLMRQTIAILNTFEEAEKSRIQYFNAWAAERALDTSLEDEADFIEWGRLLGNDANDGKPMLLKATSSRQALSSRSRSPPLARASRSSSQPEEQASGEILPLRDTGMPDGAMEDSDKMPAVESACQVVPDAQQEELVAGEVLVANVTEAVPDEQVVQAVLMADEDSINAPRLRGGSII